MRGSNIQYHCESCDQISQRRDLLFNTWGDPCCPACKSLQIVRHHTKFESLYGTLFLFKIY